MIRKITGFSLFATALLSLLPLACKPGGVGDPCTPEDEYTATFPGYDVKEFNVESKSFQCETRVCMVNHFQGRVSCKYGQTSPNSKNCALPGSRDRLVTAVVSPQLQERTADKAVYCSCRCDGDDKNARYCDCPSGYACLHLSDDIGLGSANLFGSYCVRDGTQYDTVKTNTSTTCTPVGYPKVDGAPSCGSPDDY